MTGAAYSAFDLTGRTAIVTGAGSLGPGIGIGRASALLLADAGATVGLLDQQADAAAETLQMIEERGGRGAVVKADVADPASVEKAVEDLVDKLGRLDILVNNVGVVGPAGDATEVDPDEWDSAAATNVRSMMLMAKHCIPHMVAQGSGAIVNISSIAGMGGGYPSLSYPTTKGATISLTKAMAYHHARQGIRVNAVAPGQVFTPRLEARGISEEMRQRRLSTAPLGTEGTGWDVGYAVWYLASDAARWITGAVLPVDAGLTAMLPLDTPPAVEHDAASIEGTR